jgi:hypothetical protein
MYVALAGALFVLWRFTPLRNVLRVEKGRPSIPKIHGRGSHFCVGYSSRFPEIFLKNGRPFVANNEEVNLVVYDAGFAAQRGKSFQEDLKYTKKINLRSLEFAPFT